MKINKITTILLAIILSIVLATVLIIAGSFNPEDERQIGYEFLDLNGNVVSSLQGEVVHIWNTQDDYFFNKSSGIQFTNHFQEYWSRNIFCVGYYSGEKWIKIKCADELENFNKDIQTDNQTYVNATLWKDFVYGTYNFRLGVNYYLGLNDKNLSITIYGKNLGVNIPFDLGFAWRVTDVNISSNNIDDKILINNTDYLLNGTYDLIFKDMNEAYFKVYGSGKYLKVDWNKNLNYAVKMYGVGNQEDFYVMLLINAGIFNSGIEKSTVFYWIDAPQCQGIPDDCVVYGSSSNCQRCGCDWEKGLYVNVGDSWQDIENVYVNVGDSWQGVETVRVNVGDVWRTTGGCGGTPSSCGAHDEGDCEFCGCFWEGEPP